MGNSEEISLMNDLYYEIQKKYNILSWDSSFIYITKKKKNKCAKLKPGRIRLGSK